MSVKMCLIISWLVYKVERDDGAPFMGRCTRAAQAFWCNIRGDYVLIATDDEEA